MDLVLVTGSASKAREAREIFGRPLEQVEIDLPEIQAATVEEVAREKSREAFRRVERACVVEDSALGFAAWGGLPGPFIKWFEKAAGLEALCRSLDGFHRPRRDGALRPRLPVGNRPADGRRPPRRVDRAGAPGRPGVRLGLDLHSPRVRPDLRANDGRRKKRDFPSPAGVGGAPVENLDLRLPAPSAEEG